MCKGSRLCVHGTYDTMPLHTLHDHVCIGTAHDTVLAHASAF